MDRVAGTVQMAVAILVCFRQTSDSSVRFRLCLTTRKSNSLLLNHFTPGDGYEFAHETVQKGANKRKLSVQRAWLTELEWLVYSL